MILETLFCVPGPVGPETGTACPTATTGKPPRTTSLFWKFWKPRMRMILEPLFVCQVPWVRQRQLTPPWTTSLFLILETPDVNDFGNPVCVPGPGGPETGTVCPTATTGTPPRTTTGQITIRYSNRI